MPARLRIMPEGSILPFVLVVVLFFIWGMSNNLTDILVQQFRKGFSLSQLRAQMVQSAVFFGYFCMALPAALLMRRWGYKAGIIVGLCTFGVGTLLFWPAAVIGQYGPFLLALYVVGCGSAMLETAANPLVAQMGSPETSERRLNLAQAFNPPGTITGVLVGTYFIFSGVELAPQKVAQMKAAGTYAGYLHSEIHASRADLCCPGIRRAVMGAGHRPHQISGNRRRSVATQRGECWKLSRAQDLSSSLASRRGPVLLCGRAGDDVVGIHPLYEAVHGCHLSARQDGFLPET